MVKKIGVLALSFSLFINNLQAEGTLVITPNVVDLKDVSKREKKTTEFSAINRGDEPVVIIGANVACGCTKVTYPKKPILPGDSVMITVLFTSKEAGAFYKKMEIKDSKGSNTISLKGVVLE